MGPQLACGHVLDHTLTQRADGGIGTHGELLLSEVVETSIFPQDGAPRPHYGLLSTGDPTLDRAPRAAAIAAAISCIGTRETPFAAAANTSGFRRVFCRDDEATEFSTSGLTSA